MSEISEQPIADIAKTIKSKGIKGLSEQHDEAVRMLNRVLIHSEREDYPEELFTAKAPNETKAQQNYRQKTYRPVTHREWAKAEAKFNRVFNSQNYSIDWKEIEAAQFRDEQPSDYFMKEYPEYGSIIDYFQNVVKHNKIIDPNGVLAIKPNRIPLREVQGEDGEPQMIVDESETIKPVAVLYRSDQIVYVTESEALLLTNERSWLSNERTPTGLVFEYFSGNEYYKGWQVGRAQDYQFEWQLLWSHNLEELPVSFMRGKVIDVYGEKLFKSIFYESIHYLDTALFNWSTLQASIVDNAYLEKWEYVEECDAQGCVGGYVASDDGMTACESCQGTGQKNIGGIFSSYKIRKPDHTHEQIQPPPFGYVQKNPEILQFLETHVDKNIKQAFDFISLEDQANGSETATGRQIDREDLFSFMLDFSSEIFSLLQWTIDIAGRMRYNDNWQQPRITEPSEFSFKRSQDIINELSDSDKTPGVAKRQIMIEYINKRFAGDPDMLRKSHIWLMVDRIADKSEQYIQSNINRTIARWEAVLHDSFSNIIDQLIIEGEIDIDQSDLSHIRQRIIERAKSIAGEVRDRRIDPDQMIDPPNNQ